MQQSVQCSEGRSWVLRADLNDAMENKSIRESRVLCYLWCCLVCTLYELETSSALNKTIKSKSVFLNCKVLF